jgi:hypothetical protein
VAHITLAVNKEERKNMRIIIGLLVCLCLVAGCVTTSQLPKTAVSEYLQTEGAGFTMHKTGDQMELKYAMTYGIRKPLPDNVVAKVEFENPEPNSKPLVAEQALEPGKSELLIRSPSLPGIINNHNYKVVARLYQGETLLTTHTQYVNFKMPDAALSACHIKTY